MLESLAEMTDLQTILIIIGALIIVVVITINWWQERRFHQQAQARFASPHPDVLLDTNKTEEPKLKNLKPYDERIDPVISHFDETKLDIDLVKHTFESDQAHSAQPEEVVDKVIDVVATVHDDVIPLQASLMDDEPLEISPQTNQEIDTEIKPAQDDDIKAIFEEIFSNPSKTIASYKQSSQDQDSLGAKELSGAFPSSLPAMLDSNIDVTALLHVNNSILLSALSPQLNLLQKDYDKPFFIHVRDLANQWHLLSTALPDLTLSAMTLSLQLADRAGALLAQDLIRFESEVARLNMELNSSLDWYGLEDALSNASTLDAFCIEVDKSINLHLGQAENGAFTGTKLRGLAEAQGLKLSADGSFKYFGALQDVDLNENAQPLFSMFNRDNHMFSIEMLRGSVVKGVTFQLEIPRVKNFSEAFSHMVQVARRMEVGLNAAMVDDNNKLLSDAKIDQIRQQLKVIDAAMNDRGIESGSDSALRLFS